MDKRSILLHEISQRAGLIPPAESVSELRLRLKLPKDLSLLKSLSDLQKVLEWIEQGSALLEEQQDHKLTLQKVLEWIEQGSSADPVQKKYVRKLSKEDIQEILRLLSQDLPPSLTSIGRKYGVSTQAISKIKKSSRYSLLG